MIPATSDTLSSVVCDELLACDEELACSDTGIEPAGSDSLTLPPAPES